MKKILFKSRLYSLFFPPAAAELCKQNNGGCHKAAECTQHGVKVFCSCQKGYKGDGFTCLPINPCADGFNGGCHEHAICTVVGPVSWIISVSSREVWGISPWCQQKSLMPGSLSVPLSIPVFQSNLYLAPTFSPHQFGMLSAEGWETVWHLCSGEWRNKQVVLHI